tara:strand:- start:437 stop:769 length:333 start_codon:yes stop_codon:yes gene_type:complete
MNHSFLYLSQDTFEKVTSLPPLSRISSNIQSLDAYGKYREPTTNDQNASIFQTTLSCDSVETDEEKAAFLHNWEMQLLSREKAVSAKEKRVCDTITQQHSELSSSHCKTV